MNVFQSSFWTSLFCALWAIGLMAGCGSDESEPADAGTVEDTGPEVSDVAEDPPLSWLEIADDADSVGALDCEETSTPGADMDAGILYSDPTFGTVAATLSECSWTEEGSACAKNIFAEASALNGDADGTPGGGFVALNGGAIRCKWSDGQRLQLGNVLRVIEISAEGATEAHRIRACTSAQGSDCGPWVTTTKAEQTHPAGSLFF